MFIHIGNDNVVRTREIISIIDYHLVKSSSIMKEMIHNNREEKKVIGPSSIAKSVVITNDLIYFSSLSVSTLKKRSSFSALINKFEKYSVNSNEQL